MDAQTLQDRIDRGLGTAARAIGVMCNAYRPSGLGNPLDPSLRFLQLAAAFSAHDRRFVKAGTTADPVWYGVFDSAYLQSGDYLVEMAGGRVWFVGALQSLLPATCILANCVVGIDRPAAAAAPGATAYGGARGVAPVLTGFPASVLIGGSGQGRGPMPADTRLGGAEALLPAVAGLELARGDLVGDDAGRRFVVNETELSASGWRLDLRQVAS